MCGIQSAPQSCCEAMNRAIEVAKLKLILTACSTSTMHAAHEYLATGKHFGKVVN